MAENPCLNCDFCESDKGYIWNYCQRAGISYRCGEFVAGGATHQITLVEHSPSQMPGLI